VIVNAVIILVVIVRTINPAAPHHHPLEEGESPAPDQNRAQRLMTTAEPPYVPDPGCQTLRRRGAGPSSSWRAAVAAAGWPAYRSASASAIPKCRFYVMDALIATQ
jgi:hypothetical protein